MTALDKAMVTQIVVKEWFRQNAFGIKAGRPLYTWRCIQPTKSGSAARLKLRRTILLASLMRYTSVLMIL